MVLEQPLHWLWFELCLSCHEAGHAALGHS